VSTPAPTYLPPYGQQGIVGPAVARGVSSFIPSSSIGLSNLPTDVIKLSGPADGSSFATASSSASASSEAFIQQ